MDIRLYRVADTTGKLTPYWCAELRAPVAAWIPGVWSTPQRAAEQAVLWALNQDGQEDGQEDGAEPESLIEHEGGNDPALSASAYAAYMAYSARVNHRSVTGEPLPTWERLGTTIRNAWRAAAAAAAERPHFRMGEP